MIKEDLKQNLRIFGSILPEEIQIIISFPIGDSIKVIGKGLSTNQTHEIFLNTQQLSEISYFPEKELFNGDPDKFRLGIEALRLSLAYEYDPYFSLSIARVDPLPHQLEAVYEYFMKLPRIRFLLADDPGAGKTIMAGLLIKELKIRGLIKRILIVAPANLTFQWQREMKDKFREQFTVIKGDILRANYGSNPWQDNNQAVTSISWISIVDDAKDSLLRSHWDLIIVDEAHKMSARSAKHKTLAYQMGEKLSHMTDHYLLMTATPHKGDSEQFRLFMQLLDKDIYGDVESLNEAIRVKEAPFYLRRTKEALKTFPDPETGIVKQLFTKRNVNTSGFHLNTDEMDFYDDLTRFVEDQSIKASQDDSAKGRALGFTMAMLQRRFASSIYAVRRSLERMSQKREIILADPDAYRQAQIIKKIYKNYDDFDDMTDDEQQSIINDLEDVVASIDPVSLKEEISELNKLATKAKVLEQKEIETKLLQLKSVLTKQGIFDDRKMKLLIFTEHKDTLNFLVGDGKDGRPFGKLIEWGLDVTQIHGGMKIGDRDTPNTRIWAEKEFRDIDGAQVMVATEAAGEGINLQFCWFMINYDIPWNPIRLEQRMGRIHRYGQENDCLIINFVATNTREGRVLEKLFQKIEEIENDLDPNKTGSVFNVIGEIFPSNALEKMLREMYAHNLTEAKIKDRIVKDFDVNHFKNITNSTLEGLAKKDLNLSAIIGKHTEAKERRLVPEVIEDFFVKSAKYSGIEPKKLKSVESIYRVGKLPRGLLDASELLEPQFGKLGKEYNRVVFDKESLKNDATLEWVTPGHPLFEVVRNEMSVLSIPDLRNGAIYYDINISEPSRLDVYTASIKDGNNNTIQIKLFVIKTDMSGEINIKEPTLFLDIIPAVGINDIPDDSHFPSKNNLESVLIDKSLNKLLKEVSDGRLKEINTILRHLNISLNELIKRESLKYAELSERIAKGDETSNLHQLLANSEERLDVLNNRYDARKRDLDKEIKCYIGDIVHIGRAWVLPHPDRESSDVAPMVRNDEIEKIAIQKAIEHEESRGYVVESVESQNRGFDLISRKPHTDDNQTSVDVRFIEVKGRSGIGEVALTNNEFKTAKRMKDDYWLYVVFNCSSSPDLKIVRNPAKLGWEPIVKIEHYHVKPVDIINQAE